MLPTRATLYRDGLLENAICNLCNTEEQTLPDMVMNCVVTTGFWTLFQNWWHTKTSENIKLSISHILYGWHDRTKHWQVLNYCLLIAKYCIFCASQPGDELNFQSFLLRIQGKIEILKEIATANQSLPNYYRTCVVLLKYCTLSLKRFIIY